MTAFLFMHIARFYEISRINSSSLLSLFTTPLVICIIQSVMAFKQAKPRLSKGILEMKFMQRTKAKVDREIEAAEGRAMYSSEITDKMLNPNSNFIMEPSFVHCEGLIEGRLSFRGMNPEIERLLELEQAELEERNRPKQATDVSDVDMKAFYDNNLAKTMHKKFENKRKFNGNDNVKNKKPKFLKPNIDD